jgi:DNA-binding NarL/FixJ family response regulator
VDEADPDAPAGRVLVLHPERFVRDAIVTALAKTDDLRCVGTTLGEDADDVDAVLVGFNWLDRAAVDELRGLRQRMPNATVVAVVRTADEAHLATAVELGVVVAPTAAPLDLVLDGVRGRDRSTLDAWHRDAARRAEATNLSPRELEVLRLIGDGLTSDTVARRLGITSHTCRDHLKRLRAKLDAATTLQAVVTAARLGILPAFAPGDGRRGIRVET